MINKLSIDDLEVDNKNIFMRVDFNVPINSENNIIDSTRINLTLPSINSLLKRGAKLSLVSHLGRPKGTDSKYSLAPVAKYLSEKLNDKVRFCTDIIGDNAKIAIDSVEPGKCLLFENIRFYEQEEKNDAIFCSEIAENHQLYVNDAFGSAHRAHASTYGIAKHFSNAAAGYLIIKELEQLSILVNNPKKPFITILGGAKVKDKIKIIQKLQKVADVIIIGGGMAYTFLHVMGKNIGDSLLDEDSIDLVDTIIKDSQKYGNKIVLPVDHVISESIDGKGVVSDSIPENFASFDIGPKTINLFRKNILGAKQIFWNGPMGVFEKKSFKKGTFSIADALNYSDSYTVVGGGDSISAVNQSGRSSNINHISTGGGASLKFIEGESLPAIEVLANK